MKQIISLISVIILFSLVSCDNTSQQTTTVVSDFTNQGVVKEFYQAPSYTYLLMNEGDSEIWMAINRMDLNVGQTLYYNRGAAMQNFHSKTLERDFPLIYFVQEVSLTPQSATKKMADPMQGGTPQKPELVKQNIEVTPADGAITISELFANKEKYSGKKVKVTGKITKYNDMIMSRNWFHIQDGTEYEDNFDLTITSMDVANVGATVTFEGVIALDKDFGAGYFYPVIMEEAVVVK